MEDLLAQVKAMHSEGKEQTSAYAAWMKGLSAKERVELDKEMKAAMPFVGVCFLRLTDGLPPDLSILASLVMADGAKIALNMALTYGFMRGKQADDNLS